MSSLRPLLDLVCPEPAREVIIRYMVDERRCTTAVRMIRPSLNSAASRIHINFLLNYHSSAIAWLWDVSQQTPWAVDLLVSVVHVNNVLVFKRLRHGLWSDG